MVDTGCVSNREGLWWIQGVLATGRDCGGYRVC